MEVETTKRKDLEHRLQRQQTDSEVGRAEIQQQTTVADRDDTSHVCTCTTPRVAERDNIFQPFKK